jgi:hypothetical protein
VIDGDLDRASSYRGPHEVRLRFLLFGPSMPAYLPVLLPTLSDASRNSIRDSVEIGGGGEDGGELGGEEREDDNGE